MADHLIPYVEVRRMSPRKVRLEELNSWEMGICVNRGVARQRGDRWGHRRPAQRLLGIEIVLQKQHERPISAPDGERRPSMPTTHLVIMFSGIEQAVQQTGSFDEYLLARITTRIIYKGNALDTYCVLK